MDTEEILRFLPSMEMVAEELEGLGWTYRADIREGGPGFRGVRLFHGRDGVEEEYVYVVRPEDAAAFPADWCAYLCTVPLSGAAEHICCPGRSSEEVLERMLELFQRCGEWERALDALVLTGAGLDALCGLGRALLGCPVTIHDSWFIVLAASDGLPEAMQPESMAGSSRSYIPRRYIDSFRDDPDYLRSRAEKRARLWVSKVQPARCVYANLWDGGEYLGRLLVLEGERPLRSSSFLAAECLAQRAVMILSRGRAAGRWDYHSLDDILYALLTGRDLDVTDAAVLLHTLHWQKSDQYQCVRLQNQEPDAAVALGQMIHSDLFGLFPGSYIMFIQQQQCVVLNLSRMPLPLPQLRERLEALCRDYRLYAGVSSPVQGVETLRHAFRQADVALRTAFHRQERRRVLPFSACALDYLLRNIRTDLPPAQLAAPELLALLDYDRRKGTAYFSTLRTFLINERDIPRASQALIIHRTTLLYRLKKIQSIIGADLEDPDQRLYLLLSFRLLEQTDL